VVGESEAREEQEARDQIAGKQQAHLMGDLPGVSRSPGHLSARQYNHHARTVERLDTPTDK
jgi:hypothetical protein